MAQTAYELAVEEGGIIRLPSDAGLQVGDKVLLFLHQDALPRLEQIAPSTSLQQVLEDTAGLWAEGGEDLEAFIEAQRSAWDEADRQRLAWLLRQMDSSLPPLS
jgi:hypothetical protein